MDIQIKMEPVSKKVLKMWTDERHKMFVVCWDKEWAVYDNEAYLRGRYDNRKDAIIKAYGLLGGIPK